MVLSAYLLFKVNIANLVRDKLIIVKEFFIQPSEIDRMPYWEYETVKEEVHKYLKEKQKQNEQQNDDYASQRKQMSSGFKPSAFKTPSFKSPNIKIPKI